MVGCFKFFRKWSQNMLLSMNGHRYSHAGQSIIYLTYRISRIKTVLAITGLVYPVRLSPLLDLRIVSP